MATKNSGQKKKRTPKKRKPKITLDNKKVLALASLMVFLCALFLSLAFIFSNGGNRNSGAEKGKTAVEKKVSEKKSQKKNGGKKDPEKIQPEKPEENDSKTPVAEGGKSATVQSEPVQQKKESGGQKKPEEKNSSVKTGEQKKPEVEPKKKTEKKQEPKTEEKKVSEKKEAPKEIKKEVKEEKKQPEEKKAAAKFNIPQSSNGARLCFIIDDGGQTTANIRKYTTLPFKVTVAVLPRLPCTKECARIVVQDGKELMLHQPMQAQNLKINPGPGAILPDMTLSEIYSTVIQNLSELGPGVKGLNNHEGSLITCDEMMIGTVIDAAIDRGVYFVDSRTSKDTKAPMAALERDVKILQREVFIDDIIDRGEMLKQIMRGVDIANKKGKVIMIGHVDKSAKILPQLLSEMYPELKEKGYRLVFPSELL